TFEIWGALLKGGTLIVSDDHLKTAEALAKDLQKHSVNTLWLTAGLFHQVANHHLELFTGLDYFLSGGDSLQTECIEKVRAAHPNLVFINGYGPTESTTFATTHQLPAGATVSLSQNIIGHPIANTQIYLLHPHSTLLSPMGVVGEICIGGDGLALGYLNQAELSTARFVDHPFQPNARLYRTGDLGKWLPDGRLVFLGRMDQQLKIRGYRIELGEVEVALQQCVGIVEGVVQAIDDLLGNKRLVAYVVGDDSLVMADVSANLQQCLPDYMLPSIWVQLDTLPLTANGKVDRAHLPLPDLSALSTQQYVAPSTPLEKTIAEIWADLLHQKQVGIHDDFFEMGGHSLLAMQAISNMQTACQVQINVADLFRSPTVAAMAQLIEQSKDQPINRIQPNTGANDIDSISIEDDF
ncbi:MAG: non-ribosomal peptide synthetase, partial [Bacteroidota bacterium]